MHRNTPLFFVLVLLCTSAAFTAEERSYQVGVKPVPKEKRAPVPYESHRGLLFFKATVAGREVDAMLDTGASHSLIDVALARSAGLTLEDTEKKLSTVHGELPMQRASAFSVVLPGQFEFDYPALPAIDMSPAANGIGRQFQFVLGFEFLQSFVLLVDPRKKHFQLGPSGAFTAPPRAIPVELKPGAPPLIEVKIGEQTVLVKLDTGSVHQLSLTPAAWERVIPKDAATGTSITTGGEGRPYAGRSTRVPEIAIGALNLRDVIVDEAPAKNSDGRIGMGILGRFQIALDAKAGKLWLGAVPPPPAVSP